MVVDGGQTLLNDVCSPSFLSTFRRPPLRWSKLMLLPFGTCQQNFVKTERLDDIYMKKLTKTHPALHIEDLYHTIWISLSHLVCMVPSDLFIDTSTPEAEARWFCMHWSAPVWHWNLLLRSSVPPSKPQPCISTVMMNPYCFIIGKTMYIMGTVFVCIYVNLYMNIHS